VFHKNLFFIYLLLFSKLAFSQFFIEGLITDDQGFPMYGAHVHSSMGNAVSDEHGKFFFDKVKGGSQKIYISYVGFKAIDTTVNIENNRKLSFELQQDIELLSEVLLKEKNSSKAYQSTKVDDQFIKENFAGSLAKSLDRIPGVNSIEIGAGASKPIIRGLSFNRIVVAENGSRHEGQQWGADHGLEIDALSIEDIEIIKSVGAIEFGSDAIGGVVKINTNGVPKYEGFSGEYRAFGRSVNQTIANSINLNYKKDKHFFKLRSTISDYGDYNVPTDTIVYLTVKMPVENRRLKNTAGRERDLMAQYGYRGENFHQTISLSNNFLKAGFFPGAHGVPSVLRVQDDGDRRNIDFPHQRVNHFKVISESKWLMDNKDLQLLLSYQNNRRQEWSLFHTHYAGQVRPEVNPDLELDFNLHTLESNLKLDRYFSKKHHTSIGLQSQYQDNSIGGYNFLLPSFRRLSTGAYAIHKYEHNEKVGFNFGLRSDVASIEIDRFYDPILFEYLIRRNNSEEVANSFAERSASTNRNFFNVNALASVAYKPVEKLELGFTTGTNFRLPTAIELASNGIHHGSFRHEQGDPTLNPERGLVLDGQISYQTENWGLSFSPYVYYFDNYIFLRPSGVFSPLPHGGQIFQYTESEAVMTGFEVAYDQTFLDHFQVIANFEYLWNQQATGQRSRDFPLPFSPPINGFAEIAYNIGNKGMFKDIRLSGNTNLALRQNRTAQNELTTPGYIIFGGGLSTMLKINEFKANLMLQAFNIFDQKYFNHTNFYRALEIPEMGRNIQLMISIPFGTNA
jgi:iron complex outermembrane receptor protein